MRTQHEHSAIPKTAPPYRLVPFFLLNWAGLNTEVTHHTTSWGWNQVIHSQANKPATSTETPLLLTVTEWSSYPRRPINLQVLQATLYFQYAMI